MSFNCGLPEKSINPFGAWQDSFWSASRRSKPELSHIHEFGFKSFVLNEVRKNLDSKAQKAFLLGYSRNSKAYALGSKHGPETRALMVVTKR